jgi:endonuclease/exonuclease/phosphatase (EEP) superfamily protein YafD
LLGFLDRFSWFFDLFAHFRVQYMQLCLIPFFVAMWKRRNRWAVTLVLLACINYAFVLPLYIGKPAPSAHKPTRAMLMNINAGNGNTEHVLESIRQFDPDILLLQEVTPKWAQELAVLNKGYPHRVEQPQAGYFGMMLLSKYPLEHGRVVKIGTAGVPSVIAEAYLPNGGVSIIGTHPVPPIGSEGSRLRNQQLMALPSVVMEQKHPVLLIGDLNVTPFSHWFKRVLFTSGLKNSMKGFGHQPSWPSNIWFMRIPIDHILHDKAITVHNRMTGKDVGSDHLPVIVDFSIR